MHFIIIPQKFGLSIANFKKFRFFQNKFRINSFGLKLYKIGQKIKKAPAALAYSRWHYNNNVEKIQAPRRRSPTAHGRNAAVLHPSRQNAREEAQAMLHLAQPFGLPSRDYAFFTDTPRRARIKRAGLISNTVERTERRYTVRHYTVRRYTIRRISGAIRAGRNIAGIIFAVFTLVIPRTPVPIRIIISEPVTDI